MVKKLDVQRIEKHRHNSSSSSNSREEKKKSIRDTISKNRLGKHRVRVIPPKLNYSDNTVSHKTRVAAYCRVSTAEEAQAGSFEMQIQHFKSVIDSNPDYELVEIYTDEGISGTSLNKRQGFQKMINDASNGKIDLILTKSISRFGRNIVDILHTLQNLSTLEPPVTVNFESEGILSNDIKNQFTISLLSALAELESQQKSIAVKEGIHWLMQEGLYKFSVTNILGYYRDYTGLVKIEPDEAEIIHYIFESFIEGFTSSDIATALTTQGILSPKGKNHWRSATILSILRNEKYCGDTLYQKTYSKSYLTHQNVKNRGTQTQWYWENTHPAIISRDNWNKVQEILSQGERQRNSQKLSKVPEKTVIKKIKTGVLRGYYLVDVTWSKKARKQFIELSSNIVTPELGKGDVYE